MRLKAGIAGLLLVAVSLAAVPRLSRPAELVPLGQARRDLWSTAREVVSTHPAFNGTDAMGSARYLRYVARLAGSLREPLPASRLLEDEDLVLNYLHDPHTNILDDDASPAFSPDLLPLGLYWAQGGLVAYRLALTPERIRTGDQVLAIGGVPVTRLVPRMRRYFSGNGPWLRTLAGWMLPYGTTLRWLGLVAHGRVRVTLARPFGRRYSVSLPLVPEDLADVLSYLRAQAGFDARLLSPVGEEQGAAFYGWRLTPDYGVFWLTSCDDTPGYRAAVRSFFAAVRISGVHYVVIDLQQNPGGNSAVAAPLLAHLPLRSRYATGLGIAQNPRDVFRGRLYVLVDGATMSSAVDVAELLTEASDGSLVGSPTGMASGAWGNVRLFATPDGLFRYQVSTEFVPSVDGAEAAALLPRRPLALTVRDVRQGVNPVGRWLSRLATPRVKT